MIESSTRETSVLIPIRAVHLRAGQNIIALNHQSPGDSSYIMYDYVNLELP